MEMNMDNRKSQPHSCCRKGTQTPPPKASGTMYYCPMHCEGNKLYDKPGSCPVCGMNLVPTATLNNDDNTYCQLLRKLGIALAFTLPIFILSMTEMWTDSFLNYYISPQLSNFLQFALSLPVVFYASWMFFERAWHSFLSMKLNMFSLIGIGAGAAFLFSLVGLLFPSWFPPQFKTETGSVYLYFEAVTVILTLVLLGQVLEARAHIKTNNAIKELLKLTPSIATLIVNEEEQIIPLENVKKGDLLRVKPGEKIPVDGIITTGNANIDESMISGEPIPVDKAEGDTVNTGTLNGFTSFVMKAEHVGSETLLAHIIDLVQKASNSKAPIQKLVDKISAYFVPMVIVIAAITFLGWMIAGGEHALIFAFTNALSVLIIACPCALGLATPISVMVGIGKGARNGILIKNAEALQRMDKVNTLVIDKTGTITQGKPSVEKIVTMQHYDETHLLQYCATINQESEHILAKAIIEYAQSKKYIPLTVVDFKAIPGQGVSGMIEGNKIVFGNVKLMQKNQTLVSPMVEQKAFKDQDQGKTVSFLSINHQLAGYVVIGDPVKPTSKMAIKNLTLQGIDVVMMTGDNRHTATTVAKEVGIRQVKWECMPEDKLNEIKNLQYTGRLVAMAGDGINDAPALTQADVGIAMGTGSDIAIESARITLIKGDLMGIVKTKKLSHAIMHNIKQNLFFAFIYNTVGITIATGIFYPIFDILLSPMIAAAAMSLSSISVITNALRLKQIKL